MPKRVQEPKPKRRTVRNFFNIVFSGQFIEIPKIIRRRFLNSWKFVKRCVWFLFGLYYNHPFVRMRRQKRKLLHLLEKYFDWPDFTNGQGIKVGLIIRDGTTYPKSSAFIRLISPLTSPNLRDKLSLKLYPENSTAIDADTKICIVQRNAIDKPAEAQKLINNLKDSSTALIVDTDDAFHHIDKAHPEHEIHTPTLDALNLLIGAADQVWLSTNRLVPILGNKIKQPPIIVPNSLDDRLWQVDHKLTKPEAGPIQILYMGTVSHDADFNMIFPVLDKLANKYPKSFELTVMGVSDTLPNRDWLKRIYQKREGSIYPLFVKWLLRQRYFDVGLAPLVKNEFNQSKSDIKCLDYLAAGITPVVSDIEPYGSADLDSLIIRVKNSSSAWQKTLETIIADPLVFRKSIPSRISKAQSYIWSERSAELTGKRLYKLMQALLKK